MDEAKLRQAALLILEALGPESAKPPAGKKEPRRRRVYAARPSGPVTEEDRRLARRLAAKRGIPL